MEVSFPHGPHEATDGDNGPRAREIGKNTFFEKGMLVFVFIFAILKFYIRFFGLRRVQLTTGLEYVMRM